MGIKSAFWFLGASATLTGAVLFVVLTVFIEQEATYNALRPSSAPASVVYATPPVIEPETQMVDEYAIELISEYKEDEVLVVPTPSPEVIEKAQEPVVGVLESKPLPAVPVATREAERFNTKTMLDAHNEVRHEKGLSPLTWSSTLSAGASVWAKVLKSEGCTYRHDPHLTVGENTFWSWLSISDGVGLISTPEDAVTWWADEESYYNYTTNTCKRGKDCGHYTQIVWADAAEVGCAVETCLYDGGQADVWVCRYDPPGNIIGERPY